MITDTELARSPSDHALGFIAKPTPQLRTTLAQQEAQLPPAEFAEMLAWVRSAFDKYTAKLSEFRAGAERATALHQLMDRELKAAQGLPISCRAGCGGCCHYEVEITQDEAEKLRDIVQNRFPIDRHRLDEQASRERQSSEWKRLGSPQNRCVFLGATGSCQIYEDRPAICRKHLVTTPASACTTPGATVAPVQVLMAEILLSAAASLTGMTTASLPKLLRAALVADELQSALATGASTRAVAALPPGRVSVGARQRDSDV